MTVGQSLMIPSLEKGTFKAQITQPILDICLRMRQTTRQFNYLHWQ